MNQHTKAKIAVRRALAGLADDWADSTTPGVQANAMAELADELRSSAASLETAKPNLRNRVLTQRREKMKDLIGRQVRLLRTIRTRGEMEFPAGSVMTIDGHWRGEVHLSDGWWYPWDKFRKRMRPEAARKQNISGHAGYVRRVSLHSLELLPKEEP